MKQHKWHKEIKAWADGAEIERRLNPDCSWFYTREPDWGKSTSDFRIKPSKPRTHHIQENCSERIKLIELTPEVIGALSAAGIEYD